MGRGPASEHRFSRVNSLPGTLSNTVILSKRIVSRDVSVSNQIVAPVRSFKDRCLILYLNFYSVHTAVCWMLDECRSIVLAHTPAVQDSGKGSAGVKLFCKVCMFTDV